MLVIGLLISNLSSLSVVFAYEATEDMVVVLNEKLLEIDYNQELADEVEAVEVNKKGDRWVIKNKVDEPVILNKVFLIGYAKFNEEKVANINTEYSDLSVFGDNFIEGTITELKKFNINISISRNLCGRFRFLK